MRHVFSALAVSAVAACVHPSNPPTNYSNIPCSDNCGGDATCMATCQPTGPNSHDPIQPMELTHGGGK